MSVNAGDRPEAGTAERVLVVDDEPVVREIIAIRLREDGYPVLTATNGNEALSILAQDNVALVVSDIVMPGMDGIQLLREIRQRQPDTAVIMVTAVSELQRAIEALKLGASDYLTKPFHFDELSISVQNALEKRRLLLENRAYQQHLEERVDEQLREIRSLYAAEQARSRELWAALERLERTYRSSLAALTNALEFRDQETRGHSQRVAAYCLAIAKELGLSPEQMEAIERGALLHDIGKIGVPDAILRKPTALAPEEWAEMRKHVEYGYQILSEVEFLRDAALIVLHHQERYDGTGYPQGLKGEEIVIGARIFAVADLYDAMTSDRPYRKAMSHEEAVAEIRRNTGTQLDPQVVEAFLRIPKEKWLEIGRNARTSWQAIA